MIRGVFCNHCNLNNRKALLLLSRNYIASFQTIILKLNIQRSREVVRAIHELRSSFCCRSCLSPFKNRKVLLLELIRWNFEMLHKIRLTTAPCILRFWTISSTTRVKGTSYLQYITATFWHVLEDWTNSLRSQKNFVQIDNEHLKTFQTMLHRAFPQILNRLRGV